MRGGIGCEEDTGQGGERGCVGACPGSHVGVLRGCRHSGCDARGGGGVSGGAEDGQMVPPPSHSTGAGCHGGAKMAVLAYSLGKREINQHFNVRNAKLVSLAAVAVLLVYHTAWRYYDGEWSARARLRRS